MSLPLFVHLCENDPYIFRGFQGVLNLFIMVSDHIMSMCYNLRLDFGVFSKVLKYINFLLFHFVNEIAGIVYCICHSN